MVDVVDSDSEKKFRSFIGLFLSSQKPPGFLMFLEYTCVSFQNCVSNFGIFFLICFFFVIFAFFFVYFFLIRYILYFVYLGYLQDRIFLVFN